MHRQVEAHPDSPYIFLSGWSNSDKRKPYTAGVFRRRFKRLCERAKVKPFPPYALRHSFASWMAFDGINQKILADMLGQSTTRVTDRYVHATEEHLRTVATGFESRLSATIFAGAKNKVAAKSVPKSVPTPNLKIKRTNVRSVKHAETLENKWWAIKDLNLRPLPCQGSALAS